MLHQNLLSTEDKHLQKEGELSASPRRPNMMTEDEEDVQKEDRTGLKRKPTGPSELLLERTRTRSSGEDPSETKQEVNHTSARCSAAAADSKDGLTCRGRHRNRKRSRCWSRFSSTVLCIRKKEEVRKSLENPSEGRPQKPEKVSQDDREEDNKTKTFKMRKVLRRLRTSDVQRAQSQSRGHKSPKNFQKKLQKFFIRGEKRRSKPLGNMEDMKVEEDVSKLNNPLDKETDESLETVMVTAEVNVQLMEDQAAAEGPEPPTETPVEVLTNLEPDPVQNVDINQVPVEVVSLEDDEVFVDVLLQSEVHPEEKTTRTSQSSKPSTNGPSIRIQVCPPQEEEEEEEEHWDGVSSSENHLHLLFGSDPSELQLLQTARSLVRTAMRAAVDQLSREQQNHDEGQRTTSELQIQRGVEPRGALPVSSLLNIRF